MRRPIKDLTNQTFSRLTVLGRDLNKLSGAHKSVYWICKCTCGTICSVRSDKLTNNITKSCGCFSREYRSLKFLKILSGQTFGRLTVMERDITKPKGKGHYAYWICRCACGTVCSIRGDHLRDGSTLSCGCLKSKGEELLGKLLRKTKIDYVPQYSFEDLKDVSQLRFDFAIFKDNTLTCLIEYQGQQHYEPFGFDKSINELKKRQLHDQMKRDYCKEKNIKLIEIPYTDFDKIDIPYLKERLMF